MKEGKKKGLVSQGKMFLQVLLGNALLALGVVCFIAPTGIISGGVTGISLILRHYFGISLGVSSGLLNGAAFLAGFVLFGKKFAANTAVSTVAFPVFLQVFERIPILMELTSDLFFSAILAGVLSGAGVGLIVRCGGSSGGTDIPALILQKYAKIPFSTAMMVMSIIIMAFQFLFSTPEMVLYGLAYTYVMSAVMDKVLISGHTYTQALVISPRYEELRKELLGRHYGVTMVKIETGRDCEEAKALLCAASARRMAALKEYVLAADPKAFIIASNGAEVSGRGFTLDRYEP